MKELKDLKLKDNKKLLDLSVSDLRKELKDASKRLYSLSLKLELSELKQTHLIKFLRRYIARLNTIINSKA